MEDDMEKFGTLGTTSDQAVKGPVPLTSLEAFDLKDRKGDKAKKRLFIGLVMGTSAVVICFLFFLWVLPTIGLANIHPLAPPLLGLIIGFMIALICWSSLVLIISVAFGKTPPFFSRMRGLTIKLFLPLMTLLGQAIGISKEKVRTSFIKVNNELVLGSAGRYKPEEMLMLMPHCLQNSRCKRRLTYSIYNCKRCGECPISELIAMSERYSIHLAIATGGTIARRIVVQCRPKIIVAVACDRDLSSGIQDTYPLPVYGILNLRPHGPCLDTLVPIKDVEQAIRRFMDPRYYPENRTQAQNGDPVKTASIKTNSLVEKHTEASAA